MWTPRFPSLNPRFGEYIFLEEQRSGIQEYYNYVPKWVPPPQWVPNPQIGPQTKKKLDKKITNIHSVGSLVGEHGGKN